MISSFLSYYSRLNGLLIVKAYNFEVVGALLGVESGRHLEVINSFELNFDTLTAVFDEEYFKNREGQCKFIVLLCFFWDY